MMHVGRRGVASRGQDSMKIAIYYCALAFPRTAISGMGSAKPALGVPPTTSFCDNRGVQKLKQVLMPVCTYQVPRYVLLISCKLGIQGTLRPTSRIPHQNNDPLPVFIPTFPFMRFRMPVLLPSCSSTRIRLISGLTTHNQHHGFLLL